MDLWLAWPFSNNLRLDASLFDWLTAALRQTPHAMRKGLGTTSLLIPWMIWKHRNECVFDRARPSLARLMTLIREEAAAWAQGGALGLRTVIPPTWDVH